MPWERLSGIAMACLAEATWPKTPSRNKTDGNRLPSVALEDKVEGHGRQKNGNRRCFPFREPEVRGMRWHSKGWQRAHLDSLLSCTDIAPKYCIVASLLPSAQNHTNHRNCLHLDDRKGQLIKPLVRHTIPEVSDERGSLAERKSSISSSSSGSRSSNPSMSLHRVRTRIPGKR
jgi:hypothetical protein